MKVKHFVALATVCMLAGAPAMAQDAAAQQDRAKAAAHLDETRAKFLKSIEGVSEAQWKYKPSPETWSIAEVAEHIAISEGTLLQLVETKMLASPGPKPEERLPDEKILTGIVDRSSKFQAPEFLRPANKYATKDELVKDFNASRDRTIAFVKTSKEDLRAHGAPHPVLKMLDVQQWILLISAHSERHTLQIEEVKTSPGYPKN